LHCHADEGETHLHDSRYSASDCSLCLFHISPSETPVDSWQPKATISVAHQIRPLSTSILSKSIERLLPARAPPVPTC
jgi:hypothetical protein